MTSSGNWQLHIDDSVRKVLTRIPKSDSARILRVIYLLPGNPFLGDVQKMGGGSNVWRRRIGNYRLFYKVALTERLIFVFHLERRTSSTY